ncbi:MAG: pilus assembly protein PilM [Desulfobacteraceae bacterium]|nr:pilus assembly protein PilM [Desulfobacteraceae bacterium]MBC2719561.1 pilus assembly protein PilM [Desulfobacteraceae bacterium]
MKKLQNILLNTMSKKVLGLDIRYDSVSAVLIKNNIKENIIEAHEYVPISDQKDIESIISYSLDIITKKMDITGSVCIASFPSDQISYRNIQVPFKNRKKIKQILPFELETILPFQVENLVIDFNTLTSDDNTNLIVAAVEKAGIQLYLNKLKSFNVNPKIITVGGSAAALCLTELADTPDNFLFVDTGNEKCAVFIVKAGQVYYIRSFKLRSINTTKLESLCLNIKQAIFTFQEIFHLDFQSDVIITTGNGIGETGFEQEMESILGISVKRANLVVDTSVQIKNHPGNYWKPERMDNAFALSLVEIKGLNSLNFNKNAFCLKKYWEENKNALVITGFLTGLVLAISFSTVIIDTYLMGKKLSSVEHKITDLFKTTFPDVKNIVDPLHQMKVKIQNAQKSTLFPGKTHRDIRTIDILYEISRLIPEEIDLEITKFVFGFEDLMLTGNTDTFNSVNKIKSKLEQADFFKKVIISSANIDKDENRVRFKLQIKL